jgi:adenine-specific DNA-methyltransferase
LVHEPSRNIRGLETFGGKGLTGAEMEAKGSRNSQESMTEQEPAAKNEHVALTSGDVSESQVARLRELFPEVFVEGKIDFDKLKIALGAAAESGPGRFHFSWAGKDDAVSLLQTPSAGTLVPCAAESINFENSGNIFIEGDNLEVLKLLFKPYFGRVSLINIDPPYNTGQDFVYPDNYADPLKTYLQVTGQVDAEGNLLTSNPETSGRYHSAWLSMMYPRLFMARQLLRDDGLIFISIDDHEVHHLRMLMNEVFGEENFVAQVVWKTVYGGGAKVKHVVGMHEYVVVFAKDKSMVGFLSLPPDPNILRLYKFKDEKFDTRGPYYTQPLATTSMDERKNLRFSIKHGEEEIWPEKQWQWSPERVKQAQANNELVFRKDKEGGWSVRYKQYLRDEDGIERGTKPFSILEGPYTQEGSDEITELFGDNKIFPFPKPVELIKHFVKYIWEDRNALILDFFAGSCTTAQAVLELNRHDGANRKFILVQLPERTGNAEYPTIADLGKERIRRVIAKLTKTGQGKLDLDAENSPEDLGFKVFKLSAPNIQHWTRDEERDPEAYEQKLALFNDPLVAGWKPENVIWEVALREGFGLNTRFTLTKFANGNKVYNVTDPDTEQKFMICLDERIPADLSKSCELTPNDLFVCRDVALDDSAAANLALQCRLKTI